MIEYLIDGGPYEDAKELIKAHRDLQDPTYNKLMQVFQDKLTEVAEYVDRTTREEIYQEIKAINIEASIHNAVGMKMMALAIVEKTG